MVSVLQESATAPYTRNSAKWGSAISSGAYGFLVLPDVLIKSQAKLGLDSTDMMVLINILMHWWEPENWPYPRPSLIAQRMRITTRSVERHIRRLAELGLLEWMPSETNGPGPSARRFNLQGLVEKLQRLARGAE